jgi:hypothetical protein
MARTHRAGDRWNQSSGPAPRFRGATRDVSANSSFDVNVTIGAKGSIRAKELLAAIGLLMTRSLKLLMPLFALKEP